MFRFVLTRDPKSYDFKADRKKPDGFTNNWKNNSLDELALYHDGTLVFRARCQSVANYCFGAMASGDTTSFGDTVAPGEFTVRCFVPQRAFHGEIHAIINTRDVDGQIINHDAMQLSRRGFQSGRWLIHDKYSTRLGRDSNYAWSAGCFILASADLARLAGVMRCVGIKEGDEIAGVVIEKGKAL